MVLGRNVTLLHLRDIKKRRSLGWTKPALEMLWIRLQEVVSTYEGTYRAFQCIVVDFTRSMDSLGFHAYRTCQDAHRTSTVVRYTNLMMLMDGGV